MRDRLVRRALLVVAACVAAGAFAGSLVGIATTEGKLRPNGPTAALAAQQRFERVVDRCPRTPPPVVHDDVAL